MFTKRSVPSFQNHLPALGPRALTRLLHSGRLVVSLSHLTVREPHILGASVCTKLNLDFFPPVTLSCARVTIRPKTQKREEEASPLHLRCLTRVLAGWTPLAGGRSWRRRDLCPRGQRARGAHRPCPSRESGGPQTESPGVAPVAHAPDERSAFLSVLRLEMVGAGVRLVCHMSQGDKNHRAGRRHRAHRAGGGAGPTVCRVRGPQLTGACVDRLAVGPLCSPFVLVCPGSLAS